MPAAVGLGLELELDAALLLSFAAGLPSDRLIGLGFYLLSSSWFMALQVASD